MKLGHVFIVIALSSQALVFNACAPYQEETPVEIPAGHEEVKLSVHGLPCTECLKKLEDLLKKSDGIARVSGKIKPPNNISVVFDPKKIGVEQIKQIIRRNFNRKVD